MTNEPDSGQQEPPGPCPPWCRMHLDGKHTGELTLEKEMDGYNIYLRPTDYGDGQVGMEVVVARPDTMATTRVDIDPESVRESAMIADLQRSISEFESGTSTDGEPDSHDNA